MSKELESLNQIKVLIMGMQEYEKPLIISDEYLENCNTIEKALKVFDIFKSFKVDFYHSRHRDTGYELCITDYDGDSIYKEITKEEFELLKEVSE